jgi:hypothetical protein
MSERPIEKRKDEEGKNPGSLEYEHLDPHLLLERLPVYLIALIESEEVLLQTRILCDFQSGLDRTDESPIIFGHRFHTLRLIDTEALVEEIDSTASEHENHA